MNLVSWLVSGRRNDYAAAFAWLESRDPTKAIQIAEAVVEKPKLRIPSADLTKLFQACTPARVCRDADYLEHCERRGVDPSKAPGGVLPMPGHPVYASTREWWPGYQSRTHRLVMAMYDHRGRLAGMHVRSADPQIKPKTRWPFGVDCSGLFFADRAGRDLLKGTGTATQVMVAEGWSDTFRAGSLPPQPGRALLGIEAGSSERLRLVRLPPGAEVYCFTHPDQAGDAYAEKIAAAVAPVPVYRLHMMRAL